MPLVFEIRDQMVLTRVVGEVSVEDLFEHARALAKVRDRPQRELVDFSGYQGIPVPMAAVREMAEALRLEDVNAPGSRLALVADSDAVFGVLNVYRAHRETADVAAEVFRSRAEALRWLGLFEEPDRG